MTLLVVLIDNGSAVNVLPLATAEKQKIKDNDFIPCADGVRAYDGTRHSIKGTITFPIMMGPVMRETEFQIIDIPPTYNMLLGRPWIHATKTVTSTLHQKVKLPLDDEIVTIEASNFRASLKQQKADKNTAEITAEAADDICGFDFDICALTSEEKKAKLNKSNSRQQKFNKSNRKQQKYNFEPILIDNTKTLQKHENSHFMILIQYMDHNNHSREIFRKNKVPN